MLKWILVLLGLATAFVLGPFVVGMFLPKEHIAVSSITLSRPPDSVWVVLRDLGGYPNWWQDIRRSEPDPEADGREIWIQTDRQGREFPLEVIQSVRPTLMVTRIADDKLPFSGQWAFEIEPAGLGSRVTVTEEGEVFNPVFRLVARLFLGYHGTIDRCLEALGEHFGEQVTTTHHQQD
ncbi:MAG: SRPBCC family protein [Gemmatimonadota bacterium]|nr:MAG: SRPBCC family protein [Gemmatimonadota bacterium]